MLSLESDMASERRETRTGGRPATTAVIPGRYALSVGEPRVLAPEGWRWVRLSDVARLETGHTPSRRKPEYWSGDIPWIGIKDATQSHGQVIYDTLQHTNELGIANSSARLLPTHTVCLSRTASVGYVVVMGRPMATSQDFVNWICSEQIDWRYLKYILLAENESFTRFASGTTHQTIYFPEVKAFHVCLPPIPEQRRIASVLGALDEKIDSNRRLAEAQDAFCAARFELVDSEVAGATAVLDEYVELTPGRSYATADLDDPDETTGLLTLKAVESGGGFSPSGIRRYSGRFKPAQVASPGDIIVAHTDLTQRATVLGRPALVRPVGGFDTLVASMHVPIVRSRNQRLPVTFLYYLLKSQRFHEYAYGRSHGTTVLMLDKRAVREFKTPLPRESALHEFDALVRPLVDNMSRLARESEVLTQVRDALLPRLISGQIRIPDGGDSWEVIVPEPEEVGAAPA